MAASVEFGAMNWVDARGESRSKLVPGPPVRAQVSTRVATSLLFSTYMAMATQLRDGAAPVGQREWFMCFADVFVFPRVVFFCAPCRWIISSDRLRHRSSDCADRLPIRSGDVANTDYSTVLVLVHYITSDTREAEESRAMHKQSSIYDRQTVHLVSWHLRFTSLHNFNEIESKGNSTIQYCTVFLRLAHWFCAEIQFCSSIFRDFHALFGLSEISCFRVIVA